MSYSVMGFYGGVFYFKNSDDLDKFNEMKNSGAFIDDDTYSDCDISGFCDEVNIAAEYCWWCSKNPDNKHVWTSEYCWDSEEDTIECVKILFKEEVMYEKFIGADIIQMIISHDSDRVKYKLITNYRVRYQLVANLGLFSDLNKLLFSCI